MTLIEEYNKLQDSFKDAILSEPDVDKQLKLIVDNTVKSNALMAKVEKEIKDKSIEKEVDLGVNSEETKIDKVKTEKIKTKK